MPTPPVNDGGAPLCLIVEPSTTTRRIVGRALDALGPWMTLQTEHAAEARSALARGPALVVTERRLAGERDLEFVRAIRADAGSARAVIVVLSVRRDAAAVREAREAGADTVVFKPVDPHTLAERLRRLVTAAAPGTQDAHSPASPRAEDSLRPAA